MNPLSKEEAAKLVEKHGSQAAAARAVKVPSSTFREWLAGGRQGATRKKAQEVARTRTIDDFRKEHDQVWKIRDGLGRLFSGGVIMTDAEFREAVGGNPNRWRAAADATEFKENRYRVQGELLWASSATIKEMKRIRGEAI